MMQPNPITKKAWPRYATHPQYGRARFDGPNDVPTEWTLEGEDKPLHERRKETPAEVKAKAKPALSPEDQELEDLRQKYHDDFGKRPPLQWDAKMILKRMSAVEST